ncbi:MAG: flippase-like domain-containing protein [Anaerolineae bacterium]|nr:flippase-like domain-containing protein [Anaerolineae bacterium]
MKKHWMNILRVAITVAALAFLFLTVDLRKVLGNLGEANLFYLGAAFLLFVFSLGLRAYRWFVLLQGLDPEVPFGRLLRLYFVGQFFSSFLPSGYGGDVVRALELTQDTESSAAIGTVLLDRATGLLVNFAIGLIVLPFVAARMEPWLVWLLIVVAGGGLIAGALILEGRLLRRITGWLPARLSLVGEGPLAKIYAAITGCGWPAVLRAFGVSLAFNVLNVVINWLCGQALDIGVDLGYFFVVTPLLSVATLVPSIGGWGIRENVSRALFAPTGAAEDVSAALGASIGLITLASGLVGGVVHGVELLRGFRRKPPEEGVD